MLQQGFTICHDIAKFILNIDYYQQCCQPLTYDLVEYVLL